MNPLKHQTAIKEHYEVMCVKKRKYMNKDIEKLARINAPREYHYSDKIAKLNKKNSVTKRAVSH